MSLYVSLNKQRFSLYNFKLLVFITEIESVYGALRDGFLNKAGYVSFLNRYKARCSISCHIQDVS